MASYQRIKVRDLIVNPSNDRHGDLGSELSAIEWLLVNKTEKMKDLIDDIVARNGELLEEPLVMKGSEGKGYIVYDGNRRVTCLKLLHGLIPDNIQNPLKAKIEAIRKNNSLKLSDYIDCRVEEDPNVINDLLELRHTPGNSGAGQLKWDGHEKENFLERIGRSKKLNFAKELNHILCEKGYLNHNDRIPLSTFNRLFSSNAMRQRIGVELEENEIKIINDFDKTYRALTRVAKDMIAGHITLQDVWDNDQKKRYLDTLENEGILPSAKDRLKTPTVVAGKPSKTIPVTPLKPKGPSMRDYLLDTNLPTPEQGKYFSFKFCELFYELQNTLRLTIHSTAISICFRAFLEILTNTYLSAYELEEKTTLSLKVKKAFEHMQQSSKMSEETKAFILKLNDANEYFSINTLHKVTHNDMKISQSDLRSYVNNLDSYIRVIINSINDEQKLKVA